MPYTLTVVPVLGHVSIFVCSLSVVLNAWIFYVLRRMRPTSSSIYNLLLIRHLLLTDAVTALLVIADMSFKRDLEQSQRSGLRSVMVVSNTSTLPPFLGNLYEENLTSDRPVVPDGFCRGYLAQECLRAAHSLTLLTLTLIAVDLYLFINRTLSYRNAFLIGYMRKLLLASWIASGLLALAPVCYHGYLTLRLSHSTGGEELALLQICNNEVKSGGILTTFCCVGRNAVDFNSLQVVLGVFSISCVLVTFCYGKIIATIYQVMRINSGSDRAVTVQRQNQRGVLTAIVILLQFYALFLPFFLVQFATNVATNLSIKRDEDFKSQLEKILAHEGIDRYLELLMVAYTLVNPLVYACRLSAVRQHSSRTLSGLHQRTRHSARQLSLRLLGNPGLMAGADVHVRITAAAAVVLASPALLHGDRGGDCCCDAEDYEEVGSKVCNRGSECAMISMCNFPGTPGIRA